MLVNGTYQTSFFLNDFQTTYSVYAEAYTTSGLAGSTVARQSLSTMKSNPNFQSLSTSMISLNSFLVANDSIIVTSKF
jgi:phage terminase small subunit